MKRLIFVLSATLILGLSFVSAIPPAPAPDPLVRIVSCSDSDGGLNYYEAGIFTFEVIRWTDNSPSFHPPENTGFSEDYCKKRSINEGGDCDHPEKDILMEAYCNKDEVDLAREEAKLYKEYDCIQEDKVCYYGACVNKADLEKNPRYSLEKEECKQQMKEFKQSLGFWQRIVFWFKNLF